MHSPRYRHLIAAEVRAEMARQKLSIRSLAPLTGLTFAKLRTRVNGERPFDTDELELVARALGLTVGSLTQRTEDAGAA